MSEFLSFLSNRRVYGDCTFTHTGLDTLMKGKYDISDGQLYEFNTLYTSALEGGLPMSLTEKHKEISPLLVDLDLLFEQEIGLVRIIKEQNIVSLYQIYILVLSHLFGDSIPDHLKDAYVFMKPCPVHHNGNIKDGIHIIFPKLVIKTDVQLTIREYVVKECKESKLFTIIGCKNSVEDIVDEAVVKRNNWLMYGSSKTGNNAYDLAYRLSWDSENGSVSNLNVDELEGPSVEDPVNFFSIRNKNTEISYEMGEVNGIDCEYIHNNDVSDTTVAKKLVSLLSYQRAADYNTWIEVGFCLHNINKSVLLDSWVQYSKQSDKYKDGECERLWRNFKNDGLTIGSLHRWARIDNAEEYRKWNMEHCKNYLIDSLSSTEYDVAKLIHSQYKYEYVCANLQRNHWYKFNNHRWRYLESAIDIKNILSDEIFTQYLELGMFYKKKLIEETDDGKKQDIESKIKACENLRKKVKSTRFKQNVVEECKNLFYKPMFMDILDTKTHLVCFENGVYDLNSRRFRDGRPDDYITFTARVDYIDYDEDNHNIRDVNAFLSKVFARDELRLYVLTLLASFLHGDMVNQHFHIWTGTGSNGKSTIVDLIEGTLGDYSCPLPVSLLTKARSGSGVATPELRSTKGKRFAHMQEPENGDQIFVGHMKEITGGDAMTVRGLYESPINITPQFSLVLCCNDLPQIPATDGGTWRRIRPVLFESKFVDEIDPCKPYQFLKDSTITTKVKSVEWHEAFASILIKKYGDYKDYGINTPECVLKHSKEYEMSSNVYLEFIDEMTEPCADGKKVMITKIYEEFKCWYFSTKGGKAPARNDMKAEFEKVFGKIQGHHGWNNFKLKTIE